MNKSEQISNIKECISEKILLYFNENKIKYSLKKENKEIEKAKNQINEKFSLRLIALMCECIGKISANKKKKS